MGFLVALAGKGEELVIHLYVMVRHLLVVTPGIDVARYTCLEDFDAVIASETPDEPDRSDKIFAAQIRHLLDDIGWRLVGRVLRNRR